MVIGPSLPQRCAWFARGLCLALCCVAMGSELLAQDVPRPDTTLVVDPEAATSPTVKPDEKERRAKATAGVAALAGITILGVVFAAVIIIWGARLRRLVREPLPATGRQDPFWFLRPDKSSPTETTESDS